MRCGSGTGEDEGARRGVEGGGVLGALVGVRAGVMGGGVVCGAGGDGGGVVQAQEPHAERPPRRHPLRHRPLSLIHISEPTRPRLI
eukprot:2790348-Rhodomonas_salina.2